MLLNTVSYPDASFSYPTGFMYALESILIVFVGAGLLGGLSLVAVYFGIPAAWRAWKRRNETPSRYRLSPVGEPGVHDELGSAEMRRTRRRIRMAHRMDPRCHSDAAWKGALQIELPDAAAPSDDRARCPGGRTFGDRLSAWAWQQRN